MAWRFQHHFVRACLGLAACRVSRYERGYGGHRTAFEALMQHAVGRLAVPSGSAAAEVKVLMGSGSEITAMLEQLVEALR